MGYRMAGEPRVLRARAPRHHQREANAQRTESPIPSMEERGLEREGEACAGLLPPQRGSSRRRDERKRVAVLPLDHGQLVGGKGWI